ncbi:hypothetical protein CVT26_011649 [Gymnopilus dilepis]|uniref:Uncharacterized protein n=1 Tax=Gymnopilus dilepis TaxID=231916 RepID=A0A409WSQ6_9AGAR|nr:hypothetical protein CVT26_011649 [Gymnopilus dilepis]
MIMWYPKFVLTRPDVIGLSTVDGVSANAASWKGPTILPRVIQPRLPPATGKEKGDASVNKQLVGKS